VLRVLRSRRIVQKQAPMSSMKHLGRRSGTSLTDFFVEEARNPGVYRMAGGQGLRDLGVDLQPRLGTVVQPYSLVAETLLTLQGLVPPARVLVNGRPPLSTSPGVYQVTPGRSTVEVQLLNAAGAVYQTRRATVTFLAGENAVVVLSQMPVVSGEAAGWSTGQKAAAAVGAGLLVAGIVYAVARK
jgi:hypothetical protein